ncbi:MAG: F-box protein [Oligoflexales bacterium]
MIKLSTVHIYFFFFLNTFCSYSKAVSLEKLPFDVLQEIPQYLTPQDYIHHLRLCSHTTKKACERQSHRCLVLTKNSNVWVFLPLQRSLVLQKSFDFMYLVKYMDPTHFGFFTQTSRNHTFTRNEISKNIKHQIQTWVLHLQKPDAKHSLSSELTERLHVCSYTTTLTVLWSQLLKALHNQNHHRDLASFFIEDHINDLNWSILWTDHYEIDFPWEFFIHKRDNVVRSLTKSSHIYPAKAINSSQYIWHKADTLICLHFIRILQKDSEALQNAYQAIYLQKPINDLPTLEYWEHTFQHYDEVMNSNDLLQFKNFTNIESNTIDSV